MESKISMLILESLDKKINNKKIASAVFEALGQKDKLKAEVVFVSASEIQDLNKTTRGVDRVTDVLSYPTLTNVRGKVLKAKNYKNECEKNTLFIGSIVLCEDKIKAQAKELGHSEARERTYLIVHGLMHLFGYDHETDKDKKQMRKMEKKALMLLKIEE